MRENPLQHDLPEDPWWKNLLPQELDDKQERRLKNHLEDSIEEFMADVERFIAGWEPHDDQAIDLLEEEFTRWVETKKPGTNSKIAPAQAINEQKGTKQGESASEVVSESSAAMEPENTAPSHEANPDMAAESIKASGNTKGEPASSKNVTPPSKKRKAKKANEVSRSIKEPLTPEQIAERESINHKRKMEKFYPEYGQA